MTDEQFKTWAKSFLERTDTYSSWRGAAVEAIQMLEDERAKNAKLVDVLKDIEKSGTINGRKAREALAVNQAPRKAGK